ncbi:MAG: GNAT family N-acetyltransferase [Chloroflexi bacterium]|nr:GNAT family N-acetyltransferase [Chloroflexota bacterium]
MQRGSININILEIISLPPERWRETKQLRLEALLAEPSAFASSYEDELAFDDEVWIARLTSAGKRDGNMTFFAEVGGVIVGMAGAHWSAKAKLRHVAEVYGVYVAPEMRGRGIASALVRRLLAELRALDQIEKVNLTVNSDLQAAVRLYEKLGFAIVGTARRELKVDGRYYDLHSMELYLKKI